MKKSIFPLMADGSGCWPWRGTIDRSGYGKTWRTSAHREVYERLVGPIPPGMELDHTCHDAGLCQGGTSCPHRRCVNPAHLEVVTRSENQRRRIEQRTHCKNGHEYAADNNEVFSGGTRYCRSCWRANSRRYIERRSGRSVA